MRLFLCPRRRQRGAPNEGPESTKRYVSNVILGEAEWALMYAPDDRGNDNLGGAKDDEDEPRALPPLPL